MTEPIVQYYDKLPDFANDENRRLHAINQQKGEQYATLDNDCKDLEDRYKVLKDHLHNVHLEVKSVEQLVIAKEKQAEEERHLQTLAERERGKIRVDIEKVEQATEDVQGKWSIVQSKMQIAQNRIDKFKEDMHINQKELEEWEAAAKQKEEDNQVIKQYRKEDEGRINGMIRQIEKAAMMVDEKKAELQTEITTTRQLQIELDQTADFFRKVHEERARLLAQWEATLKHVQALNEAIEKAQSGYDSRKGVSDKIHVNIAEQKKNFDLAVSANKQIERQMTMLDHQVGQKQQIVKKETEQINEFSDVVLTERQKLDKAESDVRAYNEHIQDYMNKIAQEDKKKEMLRERLKETQNAFDLQKDYTKEITEQTDLMNNFYAKEELHIKEMDKTIEGLKKQIYNLSQEVFQLRKNEKTMMAEIEGAQSRDKNLQLRIKSFDKETLKQLELLYNANFQIAQMEHKIDILLGRETEEDKRDYEEQIKELEHLLASKEELMKVLKTAIHRLELDFRNSQRRKEKLTKLNEDLSTKLNDINIDQVSLDKSMVLAHRNKEKALVQLNMIRLQIEKLKAQVEAKCDEVISLENRRQQLALSMQERKAELEAHLSGLKVQLKVETEAKHQAVLEVSDRKKRAETLQKKYDIVMGGMSVDGVEDTQTYYVIKFAREREEIVKRGDELEEEVKAAIKQLRMLERQMEKLNCQTVEYKKNFVVDDPELEAKRNSLEEQLRVARERLNTKRAQAMQAQEEREIMDRTYNQKQDAIASMQSEINRMNPIIEKLRGENTELKEKLKRAVLALKRARETVRKDENVPSDTPYPGTLFEMNVELAMQRAKINNLVVELTRLSDGNREIETKLSLGLSQIGLEMKHEVRPPSFQSAPGSARSGYSMRSGASMRSDTSSPRRFGKQPPNTARSTASNASNNSARSKASLASRRSAASNASQNSKVSVHQIEFPM